MCKCTPGIKTPWCGKPGCERPPQTTQRAELRARPGGRYRHKRTGSTYIVHMLGMRESDGTPVVIYEAVGDLPNVWVRPLTEFEDGRFEDVTQAQDVKLAQDVGHAVDDAPGGRTVEEIIAKLNAVQRRALCTDERTIEDLAFQDRDQIIWLGLAKRAWPEYTGDGQWRTWLTTLGIAVRLQLCSQHYGPGLPRRDIAERDLAQ